MSAAPTSWPGADVKSGVEKTRTVTLTRDEYEHARDCVNFYPTWIAQRAALAAALEKLLDAVRTNNPGRSVLDSATPKTADQIFAEAGHQAAALLADLREGGAL